MEKVDRLGWAAGFSLKSYGIRIGIRSNDAEGLKCVRDHLPYDWEAVSSEIVDRLYSIIIGGAESRPNVRRFNLLYGDHVRLARSLDAHEVFNTLESDLRLFVAEVAWNRVFVHAGVVGWNGKAIVIPGRSFSGKSTLVAELVKAGALYYSDEYAVLDARGRVHPFLKSLEIRRQGDNRQTKLSVSDLGGHAGTKPLPVGLVVITNFKENARWRPRELSPGKGVLELLANTVSARRKPEQALAMLHQVAATAHIVKGVRGQAADIVPLLLGKDWQRSKASS
jgi:hypothetical protein